MIFCKKLIKKKIDNLHIKLSIMILNYCFLSKAKGKFN